MWVGTSVVDMQTAGRWADPKMPAHYARAELAERGAVAKISIALLNQSLNRLFYEK